MYRDKNLFQLLIDSGRSRYVITTEWTGLALCEKGNKQRVTIVK